MASKFTVRVELHRATESDYEQLHEQMETRGFSRTITLDDEDYQLPPAEYSFEGDKTKEQVHDLAKAAARAVKPAPTPAILVTKSAGRYCSGLKKVS
jgi:hypothetical protein